MPVWHERTKSLRAEGKLAIVGITQEQHPERCRLFAQWHRIDWPILWDPFNTTGSKVVPRFSLIDEHGVVRATRARASALDTFLATSYEMPQGPDPRPAGERNTLIAQHDPPPGMRPTISTLSELLWRDGRFPSLGSLRKTAAAGKDPKYDFWLGVAYLMRHEDPKAHVKGDFENAMRHWQRARSADPAQYIWRRRIQQFGPRVDKPYPFYDWVDRARDAVRAAGKEPVALRTALTQSERAGKRPDAPVTTEPDPERKLPAADFSVAMEMVHVPDTRQGSSDTQVHLFVHPPAGAQWDREAGPPTLWTGAHAVQPKAAPDHRGAWRFEFPRPRAKTGYVLLPLCFDSGTCMLVRRAVDFTVN